jgi:hypothetical protein
MGWDGMGWDGMGWDGMGWDGMGWDGMGWDGMGWDGMGHTVHLAVIGEAARAVQRAVRLHNLVAADIDAAPVRNGQRMRQMRRDGDGDESHTGRHWRCMCRAAGRWWRPACAARTCTDTDRQSVVDCRGTSLWHITYI